MYLGHLLASEQLHSQKIYSIKGYLISKNELAIL